MDTATRTKAASDAIAGAVMSPNEARWRYFGLGSVPGGNSPLAQQQYFSLGALQQRDAGNPFAAPPAPPPPPPTPADDVDDDAEEKAFAAVLGTALTKSLEAYAA